MALVTLWMRTRDGWISKLVDLAKHPPYEQEIEQEIERIRRWKEWETQNAKPAELDMELLMMRIKDQEEKRTGLCRFAIYLQNDHDYIEAMFALYRRGGSRQLEL
jgi:hypothetical protein